MFCSSRMIFFYVACLNGFFILFLGDVFSFFSS